jgi:hypothetical protein
MPATLQSPGVSVSIINESFYTPAAPGTVPAIFVASAQDKINASGLVAPGTTAANAGKVYTITSQRDLADTFGTPLFYTDASGNPIHGGELNEYGLQAAYSLLGISSQVLIIRAPIDLSQLTAKSSAPAGAPIDNSYWLDTSNTSYGIFEWSAATGTMVEQTPIIIDDSNGTGQTVGGDGLVPKSTVGSIGSYAVVSTNQNQNGVFYKNSNANWVLVGSGFEDSFASNSNTSTFVSTTWATSRPVVVGTTSANFTATGLLSLNGRTVAVAGGSISTVAASINNSQHVHGLGAKITATGSLAIYADVSTATSLVIDGDGAVLAALGLTSSTNSLPTVFIGPHTKYPNFGGKPSGSVYIKTTSPNQGAAWTVKKYSSSANAFNTVKSPIYSSGAEAVYQLDKIGGGANIPVGTLFVESNYDHGDGITLDKPIQVNFKVKRRAAVAPTKITSVASTVTIELSTSSFGVSITTPGSATFSGFSTVNITGPATLEDLVSSLQSVGLTDLDATNNADGSVSIIHKTGGEIKFADAAGVLGDAGFIPDTTANYYSPGDYEADGTTAYASNWKPLTYVSRPHAPTQKPENGQLWYNSIVDEVDIMYHDGSTWVGYKTAFPNSDAAGPTVSVSQPTTQQNGDSLVDGDIWIKTDTETYGQEIYVYNGLSLKWVLQDSTDQTSPNGWLFADARWSTAGQDTDSASIVSLLSSDYLDPDAPDPDLYPRGMRLWNLRRSGFNIKQYVVDYINIYSNDGRNLRYGNDPMDGSNMTIAYNPDRWVSVSPNNANGSGTFGRHAQRGYVVKVLKSVIESNVAIRDTTTYNFNLIATPGYPEVIQDMISMNADRAQTAFIVGDTPMRLPANATALQAYGLNTNGSLDNDDKGAVSYSEYLGMFYPSGYTTDLAGNYIVVPPSHMMLRTIASSDQKSYPWFAPAGIRRGVVDNASSVGYLVNGEFTSAALSNGVRDVMAAVKINPITRFTGTGIVNFGQYTRANAASALDRINVARLTCYLRRQLDILARPFLFEPNDKITRNEIKNSVQKFLLELVGQRALYDFIVVCDESNNTPARIDRSELWVDIAVEPVKAVEFIYIPVRLVNTGSIKAGTFSLA